MAATIPDELLDLMSAKFPMLSDSTRLAILRTLMQGERNVTGVNSRASRARDQIQTTLGVCPRINPLSAKDLRISPSGKKCGIP